mmetsp:Transcript_35925/g.77466  ORF Transcript_35925/g.77466 Transcript_35925/m.77466 type:complete len:398 (+) Transcript_35925:293-1486(+)
MQQPLPLIQLPANETELSPRDDHSVDCCTCVQSITAQPQHKAALRHSVSALSASTESHSKAIGTIPREGMNNKKRNCASPPTVSNTTHTSNQNTTSNSIATIANAHLRTRKFSTPKLLSNKKRRVSFCTTTKLPSISKSQTPLNSIQKLVLPNETMKHSASCTSLPQLASTPFILLSEASSNDELDLSVSPTNFVNTIVLQSRSITGTIKGEDIISDASQRVKHDSYYVPFNQEHLLAYTPDKVNAVQANDVGTLRALLKAGHPMHASNRFGESMLHTSCRRGFTETVEFFVNEARVCPRIKDDMGRTPMHDVCWSSAAPNHDIMKLLICAAPEMLLSKDKRGHSPFDYARREYWPNWVAFLNEHRQLIVNSLVSSFLENSEQLCGKEGDEGGLVDQ